MGAGIAQVCAQAGSKVVLQDITEEFVQKGLGRVRDFLQKGVEKGKVKAEDRDAVLARITTTTDRKAACRDVALVVDQPVDVSSQHHIAFDLHSRFVALGQSLQKRKRRRLADVQRQIR